MITLNLEGLNRILTPSSGNHPLEEGVIGILDGCMVCSVYCQLQGSSITRHIGYKQAHALGKF